MDEKIDEYMNTIDSIVNLDDSYEFLKPVIEDLYKEAYDQAIKDSIQYGKDMGIDISSLDELNK